MSYILTNKKTGKFIIEVPAGHGHSRIYYEETDDRDDATPYRTYEQCLDGIGNALFWADIDAGMEIWNARPKG